MNSSKIHPTLLRALDSTVRTQSTDGQTTQTLPVIVKWRASRVRALTESVDDIPDVDMETTQQLRLLDATVGNASPSQIYAMSDSALVDVIWLDEVVYALLDTSVPRLGVPELWRAGNIGEGVRLCIVDSGVDGNHPDLEDRFMGEQDFTGEGVGDGNGHGTHVASIAAGSGDASEGRYRGVAPGAQIYSAKVLNHRGLGQASQVLSGLEWALSQKAQIINLSLGTGGETTGTDALSQACDQAVEMGAVVVVAAGNAGPAPGSIARPGCARRVITVGAVTDTDVMAEFSGRGPTDDGRVKPDLVVPGVSVIAATGSGITPRDPIDERYHREQGTSMAAPHVSGVVALMLAVNPTLTPDEIKTIVKSACVDVPEADENAQGAGRLVAQRAVELARGEDDGGGAPPPAEPPPTVPPPTEPQNQPPAPPVTDEGNGNPQEPQGCLSSLSRLFGG